MLKTLVVGAIAGGAMIWIYGEEIRGYVNRVRQRTAAGLEGAAERLEAVAVTVERALNSSGEDR